MDTAAQIISRVRTRLEDPDSRFFDQDDLILAYNDALDELSDATEVYESYAIVPRKKKALYTDLRGVLPDDALRVTAVWNLQSQKWMAPSTVTEMDDMHGRGWEQKYDWSRWWWMRGLYHLATFPIANSDTIPIRVHFSAMMPHVTADGLAHGIDRSKPPLPDDFTDAIENYMLYTLLVEKKEISKALQHWQEYKRHEDMLFEMSEHRMARDRTPRIGARRSVSSMGVRR